jgi:hypothetical protein
VGRIRPPKKNLSFLRLSTIGHLEGQLVEPLVQLQLADPINPGGPTVSLPDRIRPIPRTWLAMGRIGPRVQTEKSWFEIGVQGGEQFNKPAQYRFFAPDAGPKQPAYDYACNLGTPGVTPQSCITTAANPKKTSPVVYIRSNGSLQVKGVNRPRYGAYTNFRLKLPVPGCCNGLGVTFDNQGEWFVAKHGDTALDTRYYDDLTTTVNVPVWGNLSLAPKLDTYFYRSAAGFYVRAFQTSITLKYHFDWHQGMGWWKAMKYPNPASSQ